MASAMINETGCVEGELPATRHEGGVESDCERMEMKS
jgi:hypothetical protein